MLAARDDEWKKQKTRERERERGGDEENDWQFDHHCTVAFARGVELADSISRFLLKSRKVGRRGTRPSADLKKRQKSLKKKKVGSFRIAAPLQNMGRGGRLIDRRRDVWRFLLMLSQNEKREGPRGENVVQLVLRARRPRTRIASARSRKEPKSLDDGRLAACHSSAVFDEIKTLTFSSARTLLVGPIKKIRPILWFDGWLCSGNRSE
jgi:hypothetical protein